MLLKRRSIVFRSTTWSLLTLWLYFGGTESAEQIQFLSEEMEEHQQEMDQDAAALAQLASGLQSEIPSLAAVASKLADHPTSALGISFLFDSRYRQPPGHGPPARRLHQSLCVYRI